MNYIVENHKIIVEDLSQFNIKHILECGQIFSYKKLSENNYIVYSLDYKAEVFSYEDRVEIITDAVEYFINFFDLKTDYNKIKNELIKNEFIDEAIKYGNGIRILKQDLLEVIVSFVISANNNIKRIQKSIFYIRENLGENKGDYYAFPTLEKLKEVDEDFFNKAGLGYRSKQMVKLLKQISHKDILLGIEMDTIALKNYLISLSGIGPKVADCIMLFGYGRSDVFPVDTWIEKVYNDYFDKECDRGKIRENLINIFGELSGYAQQYLFYFKREKK